MGGRGVEFQNTSVRGLLNYENRGQEGGGAKDIGRGGHKGGGGTFAPPPEIPRQKKFPI